MLCYKDIVKDSDLLLRKKSTDCDIPLSDEDRKNLYNMYEYLYNGYDEEKSKTLDIRPGVGIAAPQIGVLKKMLCILTYDEEGDFHSYVMVNPKIVSSSIEKTYLESGEGCLSVVKEHKGLIHRSKRVKVKTYLYDLEKNNLVLTTIQLKGYLAVVFQHEYDHLNGVLFYDHINKENPFFIPDNSSPVVFK